MVTYTRVIKINDRQLAQIEAQAETYHRKANEQLCFVLEGVGITAGKVTKTQKREREAAA